MHVPCAEADHRDGRGGLHHAASCGGPTGALRQDAQDRRLIQPERGVAGGDPHHDFLPGDWIPVVQGFDHGGRVELLAVAEDLAQVGERLLGTAQDSLLAAEDLHADYRIEPLGGQDAASTLEVDIGGIAGEHVGGRLESRPRRSLAPRRLVGGHGPAV